MKFELPKLSYSYDALEPYLDAETMEIHYSKHHQTYLDKLNEVLAKYPDLSGSAVLTADGSAEDLLKNLKTLHVEEADRKKIQNFGGGFVNHNFFWSVMGPEKKIDEALVAEIAAAFGSVESFKKIFGDAAKSHFGSGWAWLVRDEANTLKVYTLPNQDSPLTLGHTPLLVLDVWEHAYYLKYRNKRPDFVEAWWNVVKIV
jgi:Fe-Mn family superoxide dismutase